MFDVCSTMSETFFFNVKYEKLAPSILIFLQSWRLDRSLGEAAFRVNLSAEVLSYLSGQLYISGFINS